MNRGALWVFMTGAMLLVILPSVGQEDRPVNGSPSRSWAAQAWHHVTAHVSPNEVIKDATIVFRDGKIEAVGTFGTIRVSGPVVERDLPGFHVYPSLIDVQSEWGMPTYSNAESGRRGPQDLSDLPGAYHWNEAIHPEFDAMGAFAPVGYATPYIQAGIGAVLTHNPDGIARGTGALVTFHSSPHESVVMETASRHFSFRKGTSSQDYPSSLMGAIALLEQTSEDANWYANGGDGSVNLSLKAWNESADLPAFMEVGDWQDALRADALRLRMKEGPWVFVN